MKKFEVGKRYTDGSAVFEIVSRTAKTAVIAMVYHTGKFNEKVREPKKKKIHVWGTEEVIFHHCYELHA